MKRLAMAASIVCCVARFASAQVPAGGDFRVNTYTTGTQWGSRVAADAAGNFTVVWQSFGQDGDGIGAFGRSFESSGLPRGGEFQINTMTTGDQWEPDLAMEPSGGFVVVWFSPQEYPAFDVKGRRYRRTGSADGDEFRVNTFTTASQWRTHAARAADGRGVAVWGSADIDGSSFGIVARRFDASGAPVGADFVVNSHTTGTQYESTVGVAPDGAFVIAWEDHDGPRDGSGSAIFAQRFDADGGRLGGEFRINAYTTGDQGPPTVSVSPRGGFVVAWTSEFGDGDREAVMARRFDDAGNPVGLDFVVNSTTADDQLVVAGGIDHDARGNFVVTWQTPRVGNPARVFGQRFDAAGGRRGVEFRVTTYTTSFHERPAVASDDVGNFVVTWDTDDTGFPGSTGIMGRRFGGLIPAALAVDTTGNGVLEPGDTVDVRPSWRNTNGAAQTFSGTLTNITGPAGAVYAITDPTGDYGTVPNDTNRPCLDCYAVSVSDPPTRPAVHWDASAVESILPDVQGQQKQWLLHVGRSFTDVPPSSGFYRFVETLLHHGVTGGCNATQYCPAGSTTREQMAVFVLVAKEGAGYVPPACATPVFADVPASSPFCRWIEELARRAVVNGCGGGNYCPSTAVTREQMAVFVLRTLDPALTPPACTTPVYNDVPATSAFCRWIEELTRRNVVTGCGGGNYCPTAAVTREQMGVFISATFGLSLYGP